ncbi:twin-arginine translocase subunit TatB [Sphingomonas sp. So64.6b]|uniref:Sec-independent protein translocase protein TatB n=1 Tax=Sphingomonas sp. So64.6b TaxID=2997354 RepID=UPI00160425F2|nr:Sec-independent protein translocase protein TatB [Sphingomonas sp. So64.6b]QNA83136.1 twin-arginine translocase subunit TatB [Sphingomonas sp. So64.6b]
MFDVAPTELLLVAVVALLVIGPKDLPKAMRFVGYWVGRARGVARQFRSGFDSMVREAELQDMEKRWAAENERIMREHPPTPAQHMLPMAMSDATLADTATSDAQGIGDGDSAPVMVEMPIVAPAPNPDDALVSAPKKPRAPRKKAES